MHLVNRHISLFIFLFSATIFVLAQNPYAIELSKENGLPSNVVYDIHEDKKGYIWIAGNEGLCRYDGSGFKTFKSIRQTSYAGSCINEDRFGRIWYENFDGYLYYIQHDSLFGIKQNRPVQYIPYGINQEMLFVVQEHGVDVFSLDKLEFVKTIPLSISQVEHACMFQQAYFLFSNDTLYRIDNQLKVLKSNYFISCNELVKEIYPHETYLYVVSKFNENKKLYKLTYDLQVIGTISIPDVSFIQSSSLVDKLFWLNSTHGSYAYTENGLLAYHIFGNSSISCIRKDYQQNYWIGTTHEGIKIVPKLNNQLYEMPGLSPSRIINYGSHLLLANKNGQLYQTDTAFTVFDKLYEPENKSEIQYLFIDSLQNKIYFFSSKGFNRFNPKVNRVEDFKNYSVKEMIRLDDTYLAVAVSGFWGLIRTSDKPSPWDTLFNSAVEIVEYQLSKQKFLLNIRVKSIAHDRLNNRLYFASNNGLFWKDLKGEGEITYQQEAFFASRLVYTNEKLFALSTKGNLYVINRNHEFELINPVVGISELEIKNMKLINDKLYVLNNRSIHEYDPVNNLSRKITPSSTSYEIYDYTVHNNHLIILTRKGIVCFSIENAMSKIAPRFYINSLFAGNESFSASEQLILGQTQNTIRIHFSVLDYGERSFEKIYYAVNGGEKIELPDNARWLELPMLAAGSYHVEFYLDENKLPDTVKFTIIPPVWKRWWFVLLMLLFAAALVYFYYRYQTNLLRKQVKLLNEKVELEHNLHKSIMKTIKSQMNPHFFYNALNNIQAFIFTNDKANANTYLAKFSKLTRLILEQSEKETITLTEEINTLQLYLELEKMRFKDDFDYVISEEGILNKELIELPPMLIQPYVENAVKHGLLHKENDRKLRVEFTLRDHLLIVTIDDNGIGRKKAEELKKIKEEKFASFSTQANEKRLEIINHSVGSRVGVEITDKYDEAQNPEGTRVVLTIPIN